MVLFIQSLRKYKLHTLYKFGIYVFTQDRHSSMLVDNKVLHIQHKKYCH